VEVEASNTAFKTGKGGNNGKIFEPKKRLKRSWGLLPLRNDLIHYWFRLQVYTICSMFLIEIPLQHQPPTKNSLKSGVEKNTRPPKVYL